MTIFTSRAVEGGFWVLAIVLLGVYCGLRGYGELERRAAITLFLEGRSPVAAHSVAVHTGFVAHGGPMKAEPAFERARGSAGPSCYPFYFVGSAPQRYIARAVVSDPQLSSCLRK